MTTVAPSTIRFELPPELEATTPAEHRGMARDDVRMLVARVPSPAAARKSFNCPLTSDL